MHPGIVNCNVLARLHSSSAVIGALAIGHLFGPGFAVGSAASDRTKHGNCGVKVAT